ncbi:reticulon-3 [Cuculus canorus]|uniref:reticulon-3 n=1 Tax=Cuculus canorus TaxID=55661 RepID=UPI0023AB55A4|nr:reticulon-3 [Cuculus canorus]
MRSRSGPPLRRFALPRGFALAVMAEPALQAPCVSSSSSSSPSSGQSQVGGCEGGAGSASCADPPVSSSSSQPVSLFPASSAGATAAPVGFGNRGVLPNPTGISSSSGGVAPKEPDSPESPFEVVPDRAVFDREYGTALLGEREVLSQIPEDRVCDFPAKPRAGSLGSITGKISGGLCRQTSGTAAALEEVSKCVREMHSFTSELLSWDLVERNGGNGITGNGITTGNGMVGIVTGNVSASENGITGDGNAEADSSGDSDDTVIEEAPLADPPVTPRAGVAGVTVVPPSPPFHHSPPRAAAICNRDWEEERVTLRALREVGEPNRGPVSAGGDANEPPLRLPRLAARDLLLWRDARRSAVAFGASLLLLVSFAALSAVSVVAHLALALLSVTISLRVYKAVIQALQKTEEGHPFQTYLDMDMTLTPETFHALTSAFSLHLNRALRFLLRLFLVEDLVDSLKLALTLWLLTYVGAVFNGITLLILAELLAFTLPPLYEKYKMQINHYVGIVRRRVAELRA